MKSRRGQQRLGVLQKNEVPSSYVAMRRADRYVYEKYGAGNVGTGVHALVGAGK